MFSFRNFLKSGFIKAVGKMADYQIILNAAGWHEKCVLTEEDLKEINAAIESQYQPPITEEIPEELAEELEDGEMEGEL